MRPVAHPERLIPLAFLLAIAFGTILLLSPWARTDTSQPASVITALFTATSATCVTGLSVVDTQTYWTKFGQVVILGLIQIGGFGIMTLATLVATLISGRLSLRRQLAIKGESRTMNLGDIRAVVRTVVIATLAAEAGMAVLLAARFYLTYHYTVGNAIWHGVFHAVSAFNNAGFALYTDNLTRFADDFVVLAPIMILIVAGGIGFPVLHEISVRWQRPRRWSVHTKVTVAAYFFLLVLGAVGIALFEWGNASTLGPMGFGEKLLNALFGSITGRTAGFNTFDYSRATHETWALYDFLMFIGGGSAGTAGGVKVGTFVVLAAIVWSEVRGEREVVIARRTVPAEAHRQALTVVLLAIAIVAAGTMALLLLTDFPLDYLLFEVTSAFGTVGLSNGANEALPDAGKVVVVALMFLGRVGTVTTASALALRLRRRAYRLPEESPVIG